MSEGFDFLGFRIQWRRKRGANKWHVYTFIAARAIRQVKDEDPCPDQQDVTQDLDVLSGPATRARRGWAIYFQHAVAKRVFAKLDAFTWGRLVRGCDNGTAGSGRTSADGSPPQRTVAPISANGVELLDIASMPVTRYRYRGEKIPNPWVHAA